MENAAALDLGKAGVNNNDNGSNIKSGSCALAAPCAACKLLRRRCAESCTFAPYFPADEPLKFASVHRVFGASNVNKMLQELPVEQRGDAVSSMVYEANARIRDPIYGCVGAIASLQQQVLQLQTQLAVSQAHSVFAHMQYEALLSNTEQLLHSSPNHAKNDQYHNPNNHSNMDDNVHGFDTAACSTPPDQYVVTAGRPDHPITPSSSPSYCGTADYALASHFINPDDHRVMESVTESSTYT